MLYQLSYIHLLKKTSQSLYLRNTTIRLLVELTALYSHVRLGRTLLSYIHLLKKSDVFDFPAHI